MNIQPTQNRPWWDQSFSILVIAILIYAGWHWQTAQLVLDQGELRGPDDFLRLHQIQNWLAGQSWFDLTAYRMAPPDGADIHWSRLVDLPIAGLILFFGLFTAPDAAWQLAAIAWPAILFAVTLALLINLCRLVSPHSSALLVLAFYALSIVTISETAPGRIDHHNVQTLLLVIVLLGLCMKPSWKSDCLIGFGIPLSLSIGMDLAALFLPVLIYIGLRWVIFPDHSQSRLMRLGSILLVSATMIYAVTFPFENWLDDRCDAYSLFYVTALTNLAIALGVLGLSSTVFSVFQNSLAIRLSAGVAVAAIALGTLLWMFPHCASGPFGDFSPELYERWLSRVIEAKGIFEAVRLEPHRWMSDFFFALLTLAVTVGVLLREMRRKPELLVLAVVVLICALGIFFQIRLLRTGIIASIPFMVMFTAMVWERLKQASFEMELARLAALGLVCLMLTSFFWFAVGKLSLGLPDAEIAAANHTVPTNGIASPTTELPISCQAKDSNAVLKALPRGRVMSDLNSASAILVHTDHTVISGPYHRNEAAILSVLDFFETDSKKAEYIADLLGIDYVSYCNEEPQNISDPAADDVKSRILNDNLPDWLTWVSAKDSTVLTLKITR